MVTCDISLISHLECHMLAFLFSCKTISLQVVLTGVLKTMECTNSPSGEKMTREEADLKKEGKGLGGE